MNLTYDEFVATKSKAFPPCGFDVSREDLNPAMFDFQKDIATIALKMGKFCVWAGTGLGKSLSQLEWANQVHRHTGKDVLILTPLAVAKQFAREAAKFGIECNLVRQQSDVKAGISVSNYESLHKLDASHFVGVAIDESSVLKNSDGFTFDQITELFRYTPYKSAWSATPAPNDHMEIGSQAEFIGVMSKSEMLAMFFTHDGGDTSKWILKGHARKKFWEWVATWAIYVNKPSDVNPDYDDSRYQLPPLHVHEIKVDTEIPAPDGQLFNFEAASLSEQRRIGKLSMSDRCQTTAALVNSSDKQWLVWCNLNDESTMLKRLITGAVEVKGSDSRQHKEQAIEDFAAGKIRVLVSKSSILGFGINFQNCQNAVFSGIDHSFERYYQAVRRLWRFGQDQEVNIYLVSHPLEGRVLANLKRKERDATAMGTGMLEAMRIKSQELLRSTYRHNIEYAPQVEMSIPSWLFSSLN